MRVRPDSRQGRRTLRKVVPALVLISGFVVVTARAQTSGLPGIDRVNAAQTLPKGALELTLSAGYGFTESVLTATDAHHRFSGDFAVGYAPAPWLSLALRLDGRYDRHSDEPPLGNDSGWVGDPHLLLRAGKRVSENFDVGVQLGVWAPGAAAPSVVVAAVTPELLGLVSHTNASRSFVAHANAGLRVDNSAKSITGVDLLSRADRLALGVSDSNAVLLGLGFAWRAGRFDVVGEWSWDLLVGDQAPSASESPMRAGLGVRVGLGGHYDLLALGHAALSSRPVVDVMQPLVPVDPRFAVTVALSYHFAPPARIGKKDVGEVVPPTPVGKKDVGEVLPSGQLRGVVTSFGGEPVRAQIKISPLGKTIEADPDGEFEIDLSPGNYDVEIKAGGYVSQTRKVVIELNGVTVLNVDLRGKN